MTSYLDPYTLEESMREIRSSRKETERLRTEVLDLKATIQIYVRELAELRKASSAPTIPEGWQLVPKELTPEMAEAFMKNLKEPYNPSGEAKYRPLHTWKAMLAAAPKHENKYL